MSGHIPDMTGYVEPMIGRYIHVEIGGETYRIYFEENGAGIPLVCLHTAGAENAKARCMRSGVLEQRRFTDPRLTHQHKRAAHPLTRAVEQRTDTSLLVPARDQHPRQARAASLQAQDRGYPRRERGGRRTTMQQTQRKEPE